MLACAKHYPGHGRTTTDSHEGLAVAQQADVAPFGAAVQAGVGSVMAAFVAYPAWDPTGVGASFSRVILDHLRGALGFQGLVVTDAFIMGGATAAQSEGPAAVAAVSAGCDILLYPTAWAGVVRALEEVPSDRADAALARYDAAIKAWGRGTGDGGRVDGAMLAENQRFADGLADRSMHLLRGDAPLLPGPLTVAIVDDDVGGPYGIPSREVFHATLRKAGVAVGRSPGPRPGVVLVYAEPRSWKGRGDLGARSLAQLERLAPQARLVVLLGHPRLAAQIPGDAPVLCAWHGQFLMQRAAARWLVAHRA